MMLSSAFCPLLLQLLLISQLLVILSHFPCQTRAETYQNISLGRSLSTSGTTTSWLSPSGDFAFGFTPLPSKNTTDLFLLAIWFAKTVDNAIVWTANGHSPAPPGSKLNLTSNGQLLLTNPNGDTIFNSPSGGSHAAILDTGNLVLVDASSGDTIWQSFENPTDTILPTQVLTSNSKLRSRLAATNFSKGRFSLYQDGGNLNLAQVAVPTDGLYKVYWSNGQAVAGTRLVFDPSGNVYFDLTNKTQNNITSAKFDSSSSTSEFYQKATLDIDGVFRHYIYPKNSNSGWEEKWTIKSYVPTDGCLRAVIDDCCGSGVCGYNSFCQMDAENLLTTCKCPRKYSFVDSGDEYRGCSPDFVMQRCDVDDTARFELTVMRSIDWPRMDYEHYDQVTEEQCREYCLQDCFCAVAIFRDKGCWKKRLPLANGRSGASQDTMAFIKVEKDGVTFTGEHPPEQTDNPKKECSKALVVVGSSLLGGSVLMNLLLLAYTLMVAFYFSRKRKEKQLHSSLDVSEFSLHRFTYKELLEATNGFKEELGRGAFGTVYKGVLRRPESTVCIAVKKLEKLLKDAEKEFIAEVKSIGQTHHKNLVRLLGFCNEEENRLLVYEFMSNGSLTGFLFGGQEKPDWNKRLKIIFGVARGLLYLHEECATPIIHCDIKSQNILLDDNLVARISDFGLAKLLRVDQTRTSTGIRGTKGYVAPEWFKSMPVTTKVDVYSFGVLLLEIICCRKNLELELGNDEEGEVLVYWACDCYRNGRLDILVASDREGMFDMTRVEKFVMVAIWCIQENPSLRPSMQKVTQMLEGSVAVPVPPDPSSFMSSIQ